MKEMLAEYMACPIRHVIDKFGDKWSLLVLYSLWRSDGGVMRYSELHRLMVDCSQKMLSQTTQPSRFTQTVPRGAPACGICAHRPWQIAHAQYFLIG